MSATTACVSRVPHLAVLRASGDDVADFLQAQLSNDVAALNTGGCQLNAYCDPKGRVLSTPLVCRREADWLLVVAGEPWGDLGPDILRRVHDLGIENRVRLRLNWVPEGEVPLLLAAADIVVLPYRSGSQSAVAPLALAAGLPVLSTRVGGLPEVVRHGENGVLVEPGSVEELAQALAVLDDQKLDRLAAGARQTRSRLTWDGYTAVLEGLLQQVTSNQ